jgi:hypothetical protein
MLWARGMTFRLSVVVIGLAITACADVAPYQRTRLAHPTMSPSDTSNLGREHVHAVHEGATGGNLAASSGCGCN